MFLFAGFQANAVVIGNLTYDGTYISGDGRTYLGLDTIRSWDYLRTFNATQVNGAYEDFRIANTADADYFIGSLFGADDDNCLAQDGFVNIYFCGYVTGWSDGIFGATYDLMADYFWYTADEDNELWEVGAFHVTFGYGYKEEGKTTLVDTDLNSASNGNEVPYIPWLLVRDIPEPSILALMALGIFGIGFARRRRQS